MQPVLSILIPTLHKRVAMWTSLVSELSRQAHSIDRLSDIEILTRGDDGEKPTGTKRNELLQSANGKYVVSTDDDDYVYPCYIEEILKAAEQDPDCMAINGIMTTNGTHLIPWYISKDYQYGATIRNGQKVYERWPNHITPIRASIAKQFAFPDISFQEDYQWALAIHNSGLLKTEVEIVPPLYHYKFVTTK